MKLPDNEDISAFYVAKLKSSNIVRERRKILISHQRCIICGNCALDTCTSVDHHRCPCEI